MLKQITLPLVLLVQPHLTYGIIVWGGVIDIHLKFLQNTQKRIINVNY